MLDDLLESPSFRWLRWIQLGLTLAIYSYAYLLPAPFGGRVGFVGDAQLHTIGTALLFLSLYVAAHERLRLWALAALACVVSLCFEYAQSFSPIRVFDWADFGGNVIGVGVGALIIAACHARGWLRRT